MNVRPIRISLSLDEILTSSRLSFNQESLMKAGVEEHPLYSKLRVGIGVQKRLQPEEVHLRMHVLEDGEVEY